jgi:hypothetical protein
MVFFCCAAASLNCAPVEAGVVTDWNAVTLRCVQGAPPLAPNRAGPPGLLDIALVQAAVHDAIQAIEGRFAPYQYDNAARRGSGSADAAAAAATYDMLAGLYTPGNACLVGVPVPSATYPGDPGLLAGAEAADALLPLYRPAFTLPTDPFVGGTAPGEWRPTPGFTAAANTWMALTAPFVLDRASQFRPQPPPPLTSQAYLRDYEEVRMLGAATGSTRTAGQTDLAMFWSGNPIVIWYGTLRAIANSTLTRPGDQARLLALAALAAADSQIAVYDTKAHYNFWRPITAIREGDNDGNPGTAGVPGWTPLVTTPPYADHSSGANNLSGAMTGTLRLYFGTDDFQFTISSPVAGLTTNPRPYASFSQAADDVVDVRVFQGIHFRYADELGRRQGTRIAHWVFHKSLQPVPGVQ